MRHPRLKSGACCRPPTVLAATSRVEVVPHLPERDTASAMSQENEGPREHALTKRPVSPDIRPSSTRGSPAGQWRHRLDGRLLCRRRRGRHDDGSPDGRRYKGREEFVRFFQEQWDAWAHLRMEPVNMAAVSGGRHVVEVRITGTGRRSRIEIDERGVALHDARAGTKVARSRCFKQGRRPRSRPAVGVGDVGGRNRGGRPQNHRKLRE